MTDRNIHILEITLSILAIIIAVRACQQSNRAIDQTALQLRPYLTITPNFFASTSNLFFRAAHGDEGHIQLEIMFDIHNRGGSSAHKITTTPDSHIIFHLPSGSGSWTSSLALNTKATLGPDETLTFVHGHDFRPTGDTNITTFVDYFRSGSATFEVIMALEYFDTLDSTKRYIKRGHFGFNKENAQVHEYLDY